MKVFWDQRDVDYGTTWPAEIGEALADSVAFVPILWPEYFAKHEHWCRTELNQMLARREAVKQQLANAPALIFPVKIYDFDPPEVGDIQTLDAHSPIWVSFSR